MDILSYESSYQVLLLQAADEGRAEMLFGDSLQRAREEVPPFLVGGEFPDVYFEHPLVGDPFIDVTVLLHKIEPGTRVKSGLAGEHAAMLDWYAAACRETDAICCGFELDTKEGELPVAAVHFQPRKHMGLVRPFCEAVGEPERAELYLCTARRMPHGWPLSFFGMFRGRPAAPLRVCGYLDGGERDACVHDPAHLAAIFDEMGFGAYDPVMLEQVSTLMATAPGAVDFQFDVYPDGRLGSMFAIDIQFGIERPEAVLETFRSGAGASVMGQLEDWGAADGRWRRAIESVFARAIPVEAEDGKIERFAFTLMPQWVKARWVDGVLQPAKLYHLARAGLTS